MPSSQESTGTGLGTVPYDVFLNIIDMFIKDAQRCLASTSWMIQYNHDTPSRLVVVDHTLSNGENPPSKSSVQLSRWFNIRVPSQINQMTRAMVHRHFIRASSLDPRGNRTVDAWVRPEKDYFAPFFGNHMHELLNSERHFQQAIFLPTPEAAPLLEAIQRVIVPQGCYFCHTNARALAALATLPNLRKIFMDVGHYFPQSERAHFHHSTGPIKHEVFPELNIWSISHGHSFDKVYRPLKNRRIPLYGTVSGMERPLVEIYTSKGQLRFKYIPSECACCSMD
ncbi:hypothetical protein C8034_v001936 [Colletotrichum sidae]|uniref:Uncharacterized protein n=1 Tax=Colletotrichum sidae TaxID=1347389 RepID=A0A4R8TDH7_9PEZI|nr:hypothetical protein C8034_v001936 [Colletotrichum sidae]